MTDKQWAEVDERFDKKFTTTTSNMWRERTLRSICNNEINAIKDFIHSEISRAEKEARLAGARELVERINELPVCLVDTSFDGVEQCYEKAVLLKDVEKAISEMESE